MDSLRHLIAIFRFQGYTLQGYTILQFYPLSFKYRAPAASSLNAQKMLYNFSMTVLLGFEMLKTFRVTQFTGSLLHN